MNIRITAPTLIAPIAAAALLLGGCGSASKTAVLSASPAPTATNVGGGAPPVAGSSGIPVARGAPTMATGNHDHAGESCSGRDQARYADERLICVTGRLKPKQ